MQDTDGQQEARRACVVLPDAPHEGRLAPAACPVPRRTGDQRSVRAPSNASTASVVPTVSAARAPPALPTRRLEPAEPIDRTEPLEPIDRNEPAERADPADSTEPNDAADSKEPTERHDRRDHGERDDSTMRLTIADPIGCGLRVSRLLPQT